MPPDLAATQACFGAALRSGDDDALQDLLRPHRDGLTADVPLAIHRNNVQGSVRQALAGLYPAVAAFVGEAFFDRLVLDFHRASPPLHGRLVDYGDDLPDFLSDYTALADYPWLVDVARIECAGFDVYKAPELRPLEAAKLSAMRPEQARALYFHFAPHARLITSLYPVLSLYRYAMAGGETDATPALTPNTDPQNLLVLRRGDASEFILLDPARFVFLRSLSAGAVLGEAITAGLASSSSFEPAEALSFAFSCGLFVGSGHDPGHAHVENPATHTKEG